MQDVFAVQLPQRQCNLYKPARQAELTLRCLRNTVPGLCCSDTLSEPRHIIFMFGMKLIAVQQLLSISQGWKTPCSPKHNLLLCEWLIGLRPVCYESTQLPIAAVLHDNIQAAILHKPQQSLCSTHCMYADLLCGCECSK